ncbi:ArsR/SmtB family transcription factor [Naumannella huperziae]
MTEIAAVLHALGDPVRLEMVGRLADRGEPQPCGALYDDIAKSTASYHFRLLREAGLIEQYAEGGRTLNVLARAEADRRAPGVLESVLAARSARAARTDGGQ